MVSNLQKYFLLVYLTARSEVLVGPGENARIIPHSETIAAEDLPLEHRGGGGSSLLLPDVFSVSRNVTSDLDVDLFFSLFFVFLNNQFDESYENFTIFAPAGLPTQDATRWLSAKEELTEELLLNHIVLGEHLRPELMGQDLVKSTLGGLEVSFRIDDEGEIWVNGVRVLAWQTEGKALIISMEDYLFKQEVEEEVQHLKEIEVGEEEEIFRNSESGEVEVEGQEEWSDSKAGEFLPTPRNQEKNCTQVKNRSGLGIFKSITVCTESVSMINVTEEARKIETRLELLQQLEQQLTFLREGPGLNYFLEFANKTGLQRKLSSKQTFTLLAPLDEAFQGWHPIDWGFNPFAVDPFLSDLMENLVISGTVDIDEKEDILEEAVFKTLGGEEVRITTKGENIYLNGILLLGDLKLLDSSSQVLFLDQVPWIDLELVEQLRKNYSHLETFPQMFNASLEPDESIAETTTMLSENILEAEEDVTVADEFTLYDPVNFPTTTSDPSPFISLKTSNASIDEDHVRFPANLTTEKEEDNEVEHREEYEDVDVYEVPAAVNFYNQTSDNNASMVLFKLNQLLKSDPEQKEKEGELRPRQTRIVYINNKRVQLESEVEH